MPISQIGTNAIENGSIVTADIAAGAVALATQVSGTLPVANGGTGLTAAGPAFSATSNSYQTGIPTATFTKCALSVEQFDTASCFNNTGSTVGSIPAYAFLPTTAGYYIITGTVTDNNTGSPTRLIGKIYKNGSGYYYTGGDVVTGYNTTGTAVIYFNGTTDYVELYVYIAAGGATAIESMMTGCFLRGA